MNLEELENLDIESLSDQELDRLFNFAQEQADQECYNVGIDYNIRDVELVKRLDDKLKLISLALSLTYQAKIKHEDHFYQVRMWDTIIYNKLLQNNVIVPPMKHSDKNEKYAGAVVFDPQIGMHEWIVSADLNSLYPSLIRHYNISPEKLITNNEIKHGSAVLSKYLHLEKDKINITVNDLLENNNKAKEITKEAHVFDVSLSANGVMYKRDSKGFLPQLMEEIYGKRSEMKRKMLDAEKDYERTKDEKYKKDVAKFKVMQMSYKTLLNSCYGAIGNQWFRLYNVDMAESITISGQLSIQWVQRRVNDYLNKLFKTTGENYIVAGDTDSFYMTVKPFVDMVVGDKDVPKEKIVDLIDDFFKIKIQPIIDKAYNDLKEYMNAFDQQMFMAREVIADRGIWRAKKNYALNVYDSEGVRYAEPKLKIMGIEAIKSSTPEFCRIALKESLRIILQEDEKTLQDYIQKKKVEFNKSDLDEISFPRGISDYNKWHINDDFGFKSKTPIHVKGSISYNRLIDKKGLEGEYRKITNGDKIKFIYLKSPNPLHSNVIAWSDILPPEFGLDKYIDYNLQYDKSFLQPLRSITDPIGWNIEKRNKLF